MPNYIIANSRMNINSEPRANAFGRDQVQHTFEFTPLRFPGSISNVHQMFVTQQGALHFMCFSNAIALIQSRGKSIFGGFSEEPSNHGAGLLYRWTFFTHYVNS